MLNDVLCVGAQVFADLPQAKVSKTKLFALVASEDRHLCFFTAFARRSDIVVGIFLRDFRRWWCTVVTVMVEKCGATGYKIGSVSESVSTEKEKNLKKVPNQKCYECQNIIQ